MRTRIIFIVLLTVSLNYVYGQANLNESIIDFKANCSEPITPEDTITEFLLSELTTNDSSATLSFEIIANCAQQKKGLVSIDGDTLTISETDVKITQTTSYEEADSAGLTAEITKETHTAEFASCNCLVNFYYQFSKSLKNVRFLTFHERTFKLN